MQKIFLVFVEFENRIRANLGGLELPSPWSLVETAFGLRLNAGDVGIDFLSIQKSRSDRQSFALASP
jgi:hypothetical protein